MSAVTDFSPVASSAPQTVSQDDAVFLFSHGPRTLRAQGIQEWIRTPAAGSDRADSPLQQQIRAAFARARAAGMAHPMLLGSVPFDMNEPSSLFIPRHAEWLTGWEQTQDAPFNHPDNRGDADAPPALKSLHTLPDQAGYQAGVARIAAACAAGTISKAVLAISSQLQFAAPVDVNVLRTRLRQQNPSGYLLQVPLPDGGYLVGVSPELLMERQGSTLQSNPLAGSARRLPDPETDRANADRLVASGKDHHEHRFVTDPRTPLPTVRHTGCARASVTDQHGRALAPVHAHRRHPAGYVRRCAAAGLRHPPHPGRLRHAAGRRPCPDPRDRALRARPLHRLYRLDG